MIDADLETLYRRELRGLTMMATALTGSPPVAADLVQEAFLRATRHWSQVSRLDRPGAWVRRVVVNLAIDAARRSRREANAVARLHAGQATADGLTMADPVGPRFWEAVRDLPERQRVATVLRYVADLPLAAIAEEMDAAQGTVKKLLFQARRTLASRMEIEEDFDDDVR